MPAESQPSVQLQIGHVLFMDLVGYSMLLLDEQRQFQEQLTEIVRDTEQVRIAKEARKLIRLPAGDGMALVFFDSPEAPVRCAIEISKRLKEYPQLKLRMGIHSGPINEVRDVNDRTNVAGAGINLARRVMDCGDGGHILLSKRVAEDLESRRWTPYLHDLGECAVKHGVPIFLVNFYGADFGNPESPKVIQHDILTSLAKIKELTVISRSSVMAFREAATQNLRNIGRKLGVANILEGSVRKEGDRVVLNVQLIDVQNNRQIWANRYDRTLVDSLGLQGELAGEIAETLRATLSEDEKARATSKPTQNADAYVFYLRANQISQNPDALLEDYETAEQLYTQAIELDPNFALAHARLASVCAEIYRYYQPTEIWKTKARTEAETALRLQPNLAEGHFALGQCIYWMDQDYDRALEQFKIAARLSPSNADTRRLIAAIERRQGKWQQALEAYERVAKIDPQNPNTARELINTNTSMRRWPEAASWAERMRAMAPMSFVAKSEMSYIEFWRKGDARQLKSTLDQMPACGGPG